MKLGLLYQEKINETDCKKIFVKRKYFEIINGIRKLL